MSVVENGEIPHRGPGRPQVRCDEDTLRLILDAAGQLFRADGYAGTSMNAVALRAGVSTKTLYRLVPTKAELFRQSIDSGISGFMQAVDALDGSGDNLNTALERFLIAYATLTLEPEVIAIYHLVLSECGRFPELGRTFFENAIGRTSRIMTGWLDRQCRLGRIRLDDTRLAAEMLRGMMVYEPQRAMMLGQGAPLDAATIAERARACAKVFLDGCRT